MNKDLTIEELYSEMKSTDEKTKAAAQKEFAQTYFTRLSKWAKKRLDKSLWSCVDEEEVANSVCRSVMRRAKEVSAFERHFLSNPEAALRHLLIQKLSEIGVHHLECECRDAKRTIRHSEIRPEESPFNPESEGSPEIENFFDLDWQDTISGIKKHLKDEKNCRIIDLLIEGESKAKIGDMLGMTEAGVRNRINRDILPVIEKYWPEWAKTQDDEQ